VFDRKVTETGRTIETGALEYAELRGVKFYRFERDDGQVEYVDEHGKNIRGFLLRTPVDGARMTSSFGRRRHPILGYMKAHQGQTGPHLHYEVWKGGRRVNPVGAKVPQGVVLAGRERVRFNAQKVRVERLLAQGGEPARALAMAPGRSNP
jgi:murein DD-endopeptidase MepM/ murein hydrolase activator NlpD